VKASIQIPAGWRRLRAGEIIAKGDRYFDETCMGELLWREYTNSVGAKHKKGWGIAIRRVKRRAKAENISHAASKAYWLRRGAK
jgi:hypothetical protein